MDDDDWVFLGSSGSSSSSGVFRVWHQAWWMSSGKASSRAGNARGHYFCDPRGVSMPVNSPGLSVGVCVGGLTV